MRKDLITRELAYALDNHKRRYLNFLGRPQEGVTDPFRWMVEEERFVSFLGRHELPKLVQRLN